MKKLILGIAVITLGVGLFGTSASGQLWFENPSIRSRTVTTQLPAFQYSNMDETTGYLWVSGGYSSNTHMLFDVDDLIAATTETNTAAIFRGVAKDCGYTEFKNAALNSGLGRVIVFNAGTVRQHTSGPVSSTWIRSNTVFVVTNNANIYADAGDFDYLGEYLYMNCSSPSARRNTIWKFTVGNLEAHGSNANPNLTSNKVITTSNNRVRNLSLYNIDGKDLIYYGSGTGDTTGGRVWVYDTSTDTETLLIDQGDGVPYGAPLVPGQDGPTDVMNVKVSGIGSGQMYLYVTEQLGRPGTEDKAGIQIFPLAADGKSVDPMVKEFPYATFLPQMGIDSTGMNSGEIRGFEVSMDGKYMFLNGNIGNLTWPNNAFLYVFHTPPPMGTTFLVR